MSNRITLEALKAKRLAGEGVGIKLVLSQRLSKVVCRIDLTGIGADVLSVATSKGAVKYWTGFVDGLVEVARAIPVTVGEYSVTIEGGVLLTDGTVKTKAEQIAALNAALLANTIATEAAQAQVLLLADTPNMVDCLNSEKADLQARLAAVQAL